MQYRPGPAQRARPRIELGIARSRACREPFSPGPRLSSKGRPDVPRGELLLADALRLALGVLAAGDFKDQLKDALAHTRDWLAFEDRARVQDHVVDHALVHRSVRGHLDARGRLQAEHAAAAGREHE